MWPSYERRKERKRSHFNRYWNSLIIFLYYIIYYKSEARVKRINLYIKYKRLQLKDWVWGKSFQRIKNKKGIVKSSHEFVLHVTKRKDWNLLKNEPWQKCARNGRNTHTRTHSQKKSVHLQQSALWFLGLCSGLYCHSPHFISLCLSAIALFWHSCFFSFSRWLKYSHSCPLFSSLSIYPCILFPPSQFFFPLSRVLAPPPHCLSLSPLSLLCSGCWHASSAWQSQDYFIYLLFFPPIFSPLRLSKYAPLFRMTLSVMSCSWRAGFILVVQSWRI